MQGEAALVTENVEGLAVSVLRGGGVIFALIKEGSGLLAFEGVEAELNRIHGERGGGLFSLQQAGGARRKRFQFADARVDALDDGSGLQSSGELCEDRLANWVGVHRLGEDLQGENLVVTVDDQAGEEI